MSIHANKVAAVIVTRGDVDLTEIIQSIPFPLVTVWDNSNPHRDDLAVYGRYAILAETPAEVVYVQDDDCVLEPAAFEQLLAAYQPGVIAANMPERFREHYPDSCLVGFGAIFDKTLPTIALGRFVNHYGFDGIAKAFESDPGFFFRTCDVVFTTLTPRTLVDAPYRDLPWASDASRMWKQAAHHGERQRMLGLARQVRDQ